MTKFKKFALISCSILLLVFSLFSFLPINRVVDVAKADTSSTSYSFVGSDFYLPNLGITTSAINSPYYNQLTSYNDLITRGKIYLDYSSSIDTFYLNSSTFGRPSPFVSFSQDPASRLYTTYSDSSTSSSHFDVSLQFELNSNGYYAKASSKYIPLYAWRGGSIVYRSALYVELVYTSDTPARPVELGSVVSIEFGNYYNPSPNVLVEDGLSYTDDNAYVNGYWNYLSYIFANSFRLNILMPCTYTYQNSYTYYPYSFFERRTYNVPNTTSNEYQNGYDTGYSEGLTTGTNIGYDDGYDAGYNLGNNIGYNNGYNAGIESANEYTFLGLISATIDAPIKYFQELFNFDLLGVNLQGFLTALFTLCIIVTILKLILGGK